MKKFLALVMAMMMVLAMGTVAFAEPPYENDATATFYKNYVTEGSSAVIPADTFSFAVAKGTITNATPGTDFPETLPTVSSAVYAGADAGQRELTITLPEFKTVGIYTYTITENVPEDAEKTTGVTYFDQPITLKVTVIEQNGVVQVAAVHCENFENDKIVTIKNKYEAGTLTVTKQVEGVLGDTMRQFQITVSFDSDSNMKSTITASVKGGEATPIQGYTWTGTLADTESVTFYNVPKGATYTVTEVDYSNEGYKTSIENTSKDNKENSIIGSEDDTVVVTNTKDGDIDTGIMLDNAPYMMIMAMVVLAGAAMMMKRRAY